MNVSSLFLIRFVSFVSCLGLIISCTPATQTLRLNMETFPSKPADAPIELFYTKPPQRPYVEIGIVSARQRNKFIAMDDLTESIIMQARELGGDAVIGLSLGEQQMGAAKSGSSYIVDHDPILQGVVVRWSDSK